MERTVAKYLMTIRSFASLILAILI
uniref:Uncharacterized protein n=1 Tax=Arundo donax TaxID=35708 RepID=A0A0A8ZK16_ARUDO